MANRDHLHVEEAELTPVDVYMQPAFNGIFPERGELLELLDPYGVNAQDQLLENH